MSRAQYPTGGWILDYHYLLMARADSVTRTSGCMKKKQNKNL